MIGHDLEIFLVVKVFVRTQFVFLISVKFFFFYPDRMDNRDNILAWNASLDNIVDIISMLRILFHC